LIKSVIKYKKSSKKSYAALKLSVVCLTHLIGIPIGFSYYQRRQKHLTTTQDIKAIKLLSIIATVRSQILCQVTAKMICGLKSLTFADSEVRTVRMPKV